MNPTIPYLIHAIRNATKARDWDAINALLGELEAAIAPDRLLPLGFPR